MNLFEELKSRGHDEDFAPLPARIATDDLPGSWGKISMMALRVDLGEDLWHPLDKVEHAASLEVQAETLLMVQQATQRHEQSKEFEARRKKFASGKKPA